MSFNSLAFWSFAVLALLVSYLVPARGRWVWLLAASYFFYGTFGLDVLGVLAALTLFVYVVSRAMAARTGRARRLLLVVDVAAPLAALVAFKYLNLLWEAARYVAHPLLGGRAVAPGFNLLVPIGISFYVFKLLSYALDVYHRRLSAERHAGYFALYVAYFPQILAGPIERAGALLPQLRQRVSFDPVTVFAGARLVLWGVFKKVVIANRLAYYIGEVFAAPSHKSLHLVFAAWFYYFQIYCDFSGYSDISTGFSKALGFSPPLNFNYPYLSRSISQFWTRWHITLSSWLRDYLFLPITYAVMRRFGSDRWLTIPVEAWAYAAGMLVTMVLGGLWHGAAWTFVAWGALHGVYLVTAYATRRQRRRVARLAGLNRWPRLHHALAVAVTFNLVAFAWIPFRATSFENLHTYLKYLHLQLPSAGVANLLFDLALVALLLTLEYAQRHREDLAALRAPVELKAVGYALFVVVLIVFSVNASDPFIYFRF